MGAPVLLGATLLLAVLAPPEADVVCVCLLRDGADLECVAAAPGQVLTWTIQRTPGSVYTAVAEDAAGNRSAPSTPSPSLARATRERRQLAGLE